MIVGEAASTGIVMRAWCHREWGEELTLTSVPVPGPRAGEVRIRVRASSVNPIDVYTGQHRGYPQSMRLPFVPGWDVAGTVDALGYGVTKHTLGDRVFGMPWFPYPAGTYADYLTVPASHVVPMPARASFAEAAALPMCGLTAWQMLAAAGLSADGSAGRRVLVTGASGGVGHLAVQLAAACGATVVALGRPEHHALLASLGAEVCVDPRNSTALDAALDAVGEVDVLFDVVGGDLALRLFDRVVAGGAVVLAVGWSVPDHEREAERRGIRVASHLVEPDPEALRGLARLFDDGALRAVLAATFPLAEATLAQRRAAERNRAGKVVIMSDVWEAA